MEDKQLVAQLRDGTQSERIGAAIELGHAGGAVDALLGALRSEQDPGVFEAICAGLEIVDDSSCVTTLVELLPDVAENCVWNLTHVLRQFVGFSPYVAREASIEDYRQAWIDALGLEQQLPRLKIVEIDAGVTRFRVQNGSGRFRIDYDPPAVGTTNWPRFGLSLYVDDQAVYSAGTWCPTCEFYLHLLDWPEATLPETHDALSSSVRLAASPDEQWLATWSPLLHELASGDYVASAVEVAVTRVSDPSKSYFNLRIEDRTYDEDYFDEEPTQRDSSMPGTEFYQGPRITGPDVGMPTYCVLMPSQPVDALDPATVDEYRSAIGRGDAPTVVALGWVDDRSVYAGDSPERFIALYVVDGHHKLQAYAEARRPARVLTIFMLNHSNPQSVEQCLALLGSRPASVV